MFISNSKDSISIVSKSSSDIVSNNSAITFIDIESVSWAKESIIKLAQKGIISGYEDNTFKPTNNISRAEFVKLLALTFGVKINKSASISFNDVPHDHWCYDYIATLYSMGIINGITNENFGTSDYISRQDMVTLIYRAMNKLNINPTNISNGNEFNDNSIIADYAKESVKVLSAMGVVSGVGDNNFAPLNKTTRAEVAKILCSFID